MTYYFDIGSLLAIAGIINDSKFEKHRPIIQQNVDEVLSSGTVNSDDRIVLAKIQEKLSGTYMKINEIKNAWI